MNKVYVGLDLESSSFQQIGSGETGDRGTADCLVRC